MSCTDSDVGLVPSMVHVGAKNTLSKLQAAEAEHGPQLISQIIPPKGSL